MLHFFYNSNGQWNSPTTEFWGAKIEEKLKWANTETSMHFKRANTERFMHFRKGKREPSMHLSRANTKTLFQYNVNLSKRAVKYRVFLRLAGLLLVTFLRLCRCQIPRSNAARPWKTQPFRPLVLRLTHYV